MNPEFGILKSETTDLPEIDLLSKILPVSKKQLNELAIQVESNFDSLTTTEIIKKWIYFLELLESKWKGEAKETFIERHGGSSFEKENGFAINLKQMPIYKYSDRVEKLEKILEQEKAHIAEVKADERKSGTAEIVETKEIISFTLK